MIRVEPTGHTVFPATAFDAQVQVMQALRAEGTVPVPEVLWFEEDPSILGARFVCMARVEGEVPADNPGYHGEGWMPALPPEGQRRVWESGLDTMARIHQLDRDAVGLDWIADVTPAEQLALDHEYRTFACGDVPYPAVDQAFEILEATVPPATERPALCWGDSRIGNMIFGADQRVAAVLDWEMVTAGDPVQDLAWYLLLDRHHVMAFDVARLPGLPAAGGVDRPLGGGQRPLGRAPRVVRAARRRPLRVDHGAGDEAARQHRRVPRCRRGRLRPDRHPPARADARRTLPRSDRCSRRSTTSRSTRSRSRCASRRTSDRNFYDRYYFNCHPCSDELFLVMGMGQYPNLGVQDAFALCAAATSTGSCARRASSGSTGSTRRSVRSGSR